MVRLVGDEERLRVRVERQSLWVVEPGVRGRSVDEARLAAADCCCHPPFEVRNQDAVVPRIGDEQSVARRDGQHLAGKAQRLPTRRQWVDAQRPAIEQPVRVVLSDAVCQGCPHRLEGKLPLVLGEDAAAGIDQHQRRPGADGVLLPNHVLVIIDDRVMHLQPLHSGTQVLRDPFGRELVGMNPDDDQFVDKRAFELPQLREDVVTVDSAGGPEVEQDQLAAQVGQRQRSGVEPLQIERELRSSDGTGGCRGHQCLL